MASDPTILTCCTVCGGSIDADMVLGRSYYWIGVEGGDAVHPGCLVPRLRVVSGSR